MRSQGAAGSDTTHPTPACPRKRRDLRETGRRLGSKPLDDIIREKRPAGGKAYGYTPVKGEPGRLLIVECEATRPDAYRIYS